MMKVLKWVVSILAFLVVLVLLIAGVGRLLSPITYATYFTHDIQEIEKSGEEIDMLLVGASRTYRSFVPQILEDDMDLNLVVNDGTASQPFCATYYSLVDMLRRFTVKRVVLGVSRSEILGEPELQARLILYDRVSLPTKIEYGAECFDGDEKMFLIDAYRFRDNISNLPTLIKNKRAIKAAGYRGDWNGKTDYYMDTGYVYSEKTFANGNMTIERHRSFSEDRINAEDVEYLERIVALCEENDIPLTMMTGPTSLMAIYNTSNYQGAVDWYENFAEEHGLIYHNLNYLIPRDEIFPDETMQDFNHVNYTGAERVSHIYAEILQKDDAGLDTSDYFYANEDEMKADIHRIVAVEAKFDKDAENAKAGETEIKLHSLQNDDVTPEYQILIATKNEDGSGDGWANYEVLSDWSKKKTQYYKLPENEPYKIKVYARIGFDGETMAWQVYKFE